MDVLKNLKTFVAVARAGGFSEAGRQLHVVPSVVAKRIAQLEYTVQAKLFERSTRVVALTEAGQKLMTRAAILLSDVDDLVVDLRRDTARLEGHIRVMAPTTLTRRRLGPILERFLADHERITLEIALVDASANPLEKGFDIAVSGHSASYEGVLDIPLCPVAPHLCASPSYLERRGYPSHPRELAQHECLVFKLANGTWIFQSDRGLVRVEATPRLVADDNFTLMQFAKAGLGIAILPAYVCAGALQSGELVSILKEFPPQDAWFKAFVPRRKHALARVQALLQALTAGLKSMPPAMTAEHHPQACTCCRDRQPALSH
ncbi:MAG TPA: LysR family transcriptional regulator [Ramlibacter sp.]|nr:LysR family transcriptional regulator [Ramlibacter sp.]